MPYIKQDKRVIMDEVVECMEKAGVQANGDLNYILFAFAKRHIEPSYSNYKNFIGELNETVAEIRRRLLSNYENHKIFEHGDVE